MLDSTTARKRIPINGRQRANKSTLAYDHSNGRRGKRTLVFRRATSQNIERREEPVGHLLSRGFFGD